MSSNPQSLGRRFLPALHRDDVAEGQRRTEGESLHSRSRLTPTVVRVVSSIQSHRMSGEMTHGVVVIVPRAGRFLMIKRSQDVIAPGAWCFVGGAIEAGESQSEAAVREFHEEVGGWIRPLRHVWTYDRPDGKLRLYWWLAKLLDDSVEANPAEVAEIRWCDAGEIARLPNVLNSTFGFLEAIGQRSITLDT